LKIKNEFYIKGKPWKVVYKWNLREEGIGPCLGLCDFKERIIYLDRLATQEEKRMAFIHELVHAILHEAHLHEDGGVDGFVEEAICASVADVFSRLFDFRWRREE
jgi:Zn-dependent peptidase ImmA (M78 family)